MALNWSLAQGTGFNPLETLQAYGAAADRRTRDDLLAQQRAQKERELAAQGQIAASIGKGDYNGATQAALQTGNFDLVKSIGGLASDHREKLAKEGEIIGRAAFALKSIPPEQRGQAFQQMVPRLRAFGFDDRELAGISDLSDTALDSYVALSQDIKAQLAGQLTQTRIADVAADNRRADMTANSAVADRNARLALARNSDARAAQARSEGRVRFRERDKDRAAVAAGGRGVRTDLSDLDY